MKGLVFVALLVAAMDASAQQRYATYSGCGMTFEYPAHWKVIRLRETPEWIASSMRRERVRASSARCAFGMQPPSWRAERRANEMLHTHAVTVVFFRETFEKIAAVADFYHYTPEAYPDQPGWREKVGNDGWLIAVRQGEMPAAQTRTDCCQLVIGDGWSRAWDKHHNIHSVTYTHAVVNDRRRHTLMITSEDSDRFHATVLAIAKSFRVKR